jgi:hypothetical protein
MTFRNGSEPMQSNLFQEPAAAPVTPCHANVEGLSNQSGALGGRTLKRRERRAPAAGRDLQVASAGERSRALEPFSCVLTDHSDNGPPCRRWPSPCWPAALNRSSPVTCTLLLDRACLSLPDGASKWNPIEHRLCGRIILHGSLGSDRSRSLSKSYDGCRHRHHERKQVENERKHEK